MAQLLTEVYARLPTRDIDGSSSSRRPPGGDQERRRRGSVSPSCDESSEYENDPRHKSRREDGSISVHATDDDIEQLLAKASVSATASDKPNVAGEDELAKGLIASLLDEETKVEQLLVDIAIVVEEASVDPMGSTS